MAEIVSYKSWLYPGLEMSATGQNQHDIMLFFVPLITNIARTAIIFPLLALKLLSMLIQMPSKLEVLSQNRNNYKLQITVTILTTGTIILTTNIEITHEITH